MNIKIMLSDEEKQEAGLEEHFPFPICIVAGADWPTALSWFDENRKGETAVLLGAAEFASTLAANLSDSDVTPSEMLRMADAMDIKEWFARRESEIREGYIDPDFWPVSGEWPRQNQPVHEWITTKDLMTSDHHEKLVVALLPTANRWDVNAYLQYGGWNECPWPHEHVAMAKRWWDSCGAYPAAFHNDIVEYRVLRPIATPEEAMAMAAEHFLYCMDIVDQGTQTLEALASSLVGSSVWYFWWD